MNKPLPQKNNSAQGLPKPNKFIYWTPRILSIIFISFLLLMSIDVFDGQSSAKDIVIGLFMHNIPAFILLIILIISWKREIFGGIAFILAGILYIILLARNPFEWFYLVWALQISGIAFFIGTLFLIGWFKKKKN